MTVDALEKGKILQTQIAALVKDYELVKTASIVSLKLDNNQRLDFVCENKSLRG